MKKARFSKILFICGIIIFSLLMLSLSFNEHTIRPRKTIFISICTLPTSVEHCVMDKTIRDEFYKKSADFDLRISSYMLNSGSQVEGTLLELAQKQDHIICIINYINPGLHNKLIGVYPGIEFIFIGSYTEKKVLYEQVDAYLNRIKDKK